MSGRIAVTIGRVVRRVHTARLYIGEVELDQAASRHARDVLRLAVGTTVEVFDDAGAVAAGTIVRLEPVVAVRVDAVETHRDAGVIEVTVAAAVPKGDRADWMVEKLSEVGCARFVPLAAARSVVLPEGKNKRERWTRIATEAAKQSRRRGVMRIEELAKVADATSRATAGAAFVMSTAPDAAPALSALAGNTSDEVTLFIGPEGGWTDEELALFTRHGVAHAKLTETVLRVETAAVVAASVSLLARASFNPRSGL